MMQFKALHVPALNQEVGEMLNRLIDELPGIEQVVIEVDRQEIDIIFDDAELAFKVLAATMARAGCPLWDIRAAVLTEINPSIVHTDP